MIDWPQKVKDLKRMAGELEQWALRAQGRERLVLGRIADDLRRLAADVAYHLDEVPANHAGIDQPIPNWLTDETGEDELAYPDGDYDEGWQPGDYDDDYPPES